MKLKRISAAALAAAIMAGTAVTASAEELPLLSEYDGFRNYLMGDLVLSETPQVSLFVISPIEEKKADYIDAVIPETLDGYDYKLELIGAPPMFAISDFHDCPNLKTVTIPHSTSFDMKWRLRSISEEAFSNCPNLTDIYYAGTEEDWNNVILNSFYGGDRDLTQDEKLKKLGLENVTIHFESTGSDNSGNNGTSNTDNGNTSNTDTNSTNNTTDTNSTNKDNNSDTGVGGIAVLASTVVLAGVALIIAHKKK